MALAQKHLQRAALLQKTADDLETLNTKRSGDTLNKQMTPAAVQQRNVAISASRVDDDLAKLVRDKIGVSLNKYAATIGTSPSSLSLYRRGKLAVPPRIYERVKRDVGFTAWPAGVAE